MNKENADWLRMRFKKNKVWVATGPAGQPRVEDGKVLIKYQLDQVHEYRVHNKHVRPLEPAETSGTAASGQVAVTPVKAVSGQINKKVENDRVVHVYTDGASSGNPGPSGIGVLLRYGSHEKEISRYIGTATNNIAELEAIRVGLSLIRNPALPVRVYTDSSYALGLLAKGWKALKNQELVASIQKIVSEFEDISFVKVKGHSGDAGNERVDGLATDAIAREKK
ncbi:MAG: ribonuclease H [Desulfobacterales bacterium]|nr:ribonuclease H [Desulfobacterales bacterium]MDX2512196.1 ribonuclease H [Desulfobacterales bacterium]